MTFVLVLLIGAALSMPRSEPACSRFDYEEKLMTKTVKLEATVDGLKENVLKLEEKLQTVDDLVYKVEKIEITLRDLETKKQETAETSGMTNVYQ